MTYQETQRENCIIIHISGRFVAADSKDFKSQIPTWLSASKNIIFDLKDMIYIDSTGLGCLVHVLQSTQLISGSTKLVALQNRPKIVFEITKVIRVFDIYESIEDACNSLNIDSP